jgi:DNA-binding transcriptional LysR family regulator
MVELRTLAYFRVACRSRSYAAAANALGIAVSTLSMNMKELERDLGLKLFRRIKNGVYPTEDAVSLMATADQLILAELFVRRWIAAPKEMEFERLTVNIGLSFTIGRLSKALCDVSDKMGDLHPGLFIEPVWLDETPTSSVGSLRESSTKCLQNHVNIILENSTSHRIAHTAKLLSDRWVFVCRLPAGTRKQPSITDLTSGHIMVPSLSPLLIEQAHRYFNQNSKINSVSFLTDHPCELPRLIDSHTHAVFFMPQSMISPRLGMLNVALVEPDEPVNVTIVAETNEYNPLTTEFLEHLKLSLDNKNDLLAVRPVITRRQLSYFKTIHRHRGISAAAHSANITQSSLSVQLKKLESSLGSLLFKRHSDGVVPTTEGDRFAEAGKLIEVGFEALDNSNIGRTSPVGRRVDVGILPSVSQHGSLVNIIAEAILDVEERIPTVQFSIQEAPNSKLQNWIMRGVVGIAIVETALPHMPRFPLGSSEELMVVSHSKHNLVSPNPVTFSELTRLKLVLPTHRFGLRQLLESVARQSNLIIEPYMEVGSLPMIVAMLSKLPVCTVLPLSAVAGEIASGELVGRPIVSPTVYRRLFMIYSAERTLNEAERGLIDALRDKLSAS